MIAAMTHQSNAVPDPVGLLAAALFMAALGAIFAFNLGNLRPDTKPFSAWGRWLEAKNARPDPLPVLIGIGWTFLVVGTLLAILAGLYLLGV